MRLIFQFVLLAVLDVADGLTAVICALILQPASPEYYFVQVLTVPFYLPLHIILVITLLDFFKAGVLTPVRAVTDTNSLSPVSAVTDTNSQPSSDQKVRSAV